MAGGDRKKNVREAPYLSEEILYHHIFVKLHIQDIIPCKYVCKAWNRVIRDPKFAIMHFNQNRHQYSQKLLIKDEHNKYYSADYQQAIATKTRVLDALKFNFSEQEAYSGSSKLLGSQNGLVLLEIFTRLLLWNPTTGESKFIRDPNPSIELYHLFGFAYDSANDDYKIVRIIHAHICLVDIYSLKNDSWKIVKKADANWSCFKPVNDRNPGPFEVNGYMYWLVTSRGTTMYDSLVVGFSLTEEKFNTLKWPEELHEFPYESEACWGLAALGKSDLAAFMFWKEVGLFVYTMKEPEKKLEREWVELMRLSISNNLDCKLTTLIKPLLITDEGKILLLISFGSVDHLKQKFGVYDPQVEKMIVYDPEEKMFVYDSEENRLEYIQINGVESSNYFSEITYIQNLVSPNHFGF